jgi:hypothetical protein
VKPSSGERKWHVEVAHGPKRGSTRRRDGPIAAAQCMSCERDCPLSVGVGRGHGAADHLTSRDTAVTEFVSPHHNAWLDAKARPMLVLTPKRHVRRLAELR